MVWHFTPTLSFPVPSHASPLSERQQATAASTYLAGAQSVAWLPRHVWPSTRCTGIITCTWSLHTETSLQPLIRPWRTVWMCWPCI
ncbi:unnamed protein product [Closterium sp. NIES-53]